MGEPILAATLEKMATGHAVQGKIHPRISLYRVVAIGCGFVFAFAAFMKVDEMRVFWPPAIWKVALVQAELLMAVWLFSNYRPKWCRRVAIVCCGCFFLVAAIEGLAGYSSCGCFGRAHVNPWLTAGFDATAFIGLLASKARVSRLPTWKRVAWLAVVLTISSVAWCRVVWFRPMLLRGDTVQKPDSTPKLPDDGIIVIEAETWLGKPLPLVNFINDGQSLLRGDQLVVLYHYDCESCQRAISMYARASLEGNIPALTLVAMPPYGEAEQSNLANLGSVRLLRLSSQREWFAPTPVVMLLKDGLVVKAIEGEAATDPQAMLSQRH
jgi:hypothetical protein